MRQRILITGAFGALGAAAARAATEAGANVALIDFAPAPEAASPAAFARGGIDLADAAQARAAIEAAVQALEGLDALLNIAGGFAWETTAEGSTETWERLHRINLLTCLEASRAAIPHLARTGGGRIVNVGANAAMKGGAGMGAYAASKAAVHRLTESLAEELKTSGITVNAVLPSILDTPANRKDMPDADPGVWVSPARLAQVMLFLASPAAADITGALIPVVGRT